MFTGSVHRESWVNKDSAEKPRRKPGSRPATVFFRDPFSLSLLVVEPSGIRPFRFKPRAQLESNPSLFLKSCCNCSRFAHRSARCCFSSGSGGWGVVAWFAGSFATSPSLRPSFGAQETTTSAYLGQFGRSVGIYVFLQESTSAITTTSSACRASDLS